MLSTIKARLRILALGASGVVWILIKEAKLPLLAAVMAGFGGVIAELGRWEIHNTDNPVCGGVVAARGRRRVRIVQSDRYSRLEEEEALSS